MKTLVELGVHPTPWKCESKEDFWAILAGDALPRNERHCICEGFSNELAKGKLMAAAPELYDLAWMFLRCMEQHYNKGTIDNRGTIALVNLALIAKNALEKAGGKE